ncbi:hypothetical protein [Streptomyces acidicola]
MLEEAVLHRRVADRAVITRRRCA